VKLKIVFFALIAVMLSILLSGCSAAAMRSNSWAGLSTDEDNAYLANKSFVYAIQANNGSVLWQYPEEKADSKEAFFSTPVLTEDGQVLVASAGTNHSLISLNVDNGNFNWSFSDSEGTWIAHPLVMDETIYAPNTDGKLYALDMNGNFLWAKHIGGPLWASPVTDGEYLYLSSLDHHLHVFDPASEELLWSTEISGAAPGSAVLDQENNTLYLGSFGAKIEAIDADTHNVRWQVDTEGWIWGAPALEENTLFAGDLEGNLYAINTEDGSLLWNPVKPNGTIVGSPLITENFVAIGTESGVAYAINREGKIVWQQDIGGNLYTAPVQSGEFILFSPMETDSILVALDAEGRQVWQFAPEN